MPVKPAPNVGLTLFVAPNSLAGDWARLVLAEKDVDGADVRTMRPGAIDEDFLVLNPAQTLPTLADREGVITGARVIAEYLDDRYPHPPLMPLEPAGRARVRMLLARLDQDLFPLTEQVSAGGAEGTAAKKALIAALKANARQFPARGYYLGADCTLADCAWAVLLRRIADLALSLPPEVATVRAYAGKLAARPAFVRCFTPPAPVADVMQPATRRRA